MKVWQKNLILVIFVVIIAAAPLFLLKGAEFGGADGQASEYIAERAPDYEPWFEPLFELPSGEVESLLFAVQAGLGAGVVGFILGRVTAKKPEAAAEASVEPTQEKA